MQRRLPPTLLLLCSSFPATVFSHAVLTVPPPRPYVSTPPGAKLTPFASAKTISDASCGGVPNKDPGVTKPTVAFAPGSAVTVSWQLTIPHNADNLDTGVRIAIHYGVGDSFTQNILAGGLEGDVGTIPLSAAPVGGETAVTDSIER